MESKDGREMLPLRFCLIGVGLILLAFGFLWWVGPLPEVEFYQNYYFPVALFVEFIFISLFGAGALSIFRGLRLTFGEESATKPLPRIFPELRLRNVTAWNRRSSGPSLIPAMLNAFSVSWICVLMNLLIIFQMFGPWPSHGLRVDWRERSHIAATESPWAETMSVYVRANRLFLVNGKAVNATGLESMLTTELGRRAVWTVYVDADPDSMFADTALAIDKIQGLGGRVVWITPRMRQEWEKEKGALSPYSLDDRRR